MTSSIYRRLYWAVGILGLIFAVGTFGFWLIGGMDSDLVDAFYMTAITIMTIGFTEVIDLQGEPFNQLFTVFIAITGILATTFIFSNFTALIVEGELQQTFRRRRMEKQMKKLENHYIVCGAGRVGTHILHELYTTNRPVVVIEKAREIVDDIEKNYPSVLVIEGDADTEEALLKSGVKNAVGVFASTGEDNQNLVISLTAKFLNPKVRVVARCLEAANQAKMKKAGADTVISENFIAGMRMASEMIRPTVTTFLDKMLGDRDKNLRVEEVTVGSKYGGKSVSEIGLKDFTDTLLLAVASGDNWVYNPKGEQSLSKGDRLIVITSPAERAKLQSRFTQ